MSIRNLDALLAPRSIALIGASDQPQSVGDVLAANLLQGGFAGDIAFVNPHADTIHGRPAFKAIADLTVAPDLAVIATPARSIPGLVSELGARGCRAAVVISAGFEAADPATAELRQALLDAARPHLFRIIGPNCLGVLSPAHGINASFSRGQAPAGNLALVTQSGAVAAAALDWAPAHGVGFSHIVTLGDSLDIDSGDLLEFLAGDPETEAVLLYVESLKNASKFMRTARLAAQAKPVIVIKGGRSESGAKAAFSHTGALAGSNAVYEAAFRQAGLLQVDSLDAFLDAATIFARYPASKAERLAILTNGGGAGVLAVDAMETYGARAAELSPASIAAIDAGAPTNWSRRNPVDILGDARPEHYGRTLVALLDSPDVDAALVMNCPTAVADSTQAAQAVTSAARERPDKPVIASWLGHRSVELGRRQLIGSSIPTFSSPEAAVRSFAMLGACRKLREQAAPISPAATGAIDSVRGKAVLAAALEEHRHVLSPTEIFALLEAYGIPLLETRLARNAVEAGIAAAAIAVPVALKILSPDISHKSDVGGVQLNLRGRVDVTAAATRMQASIKALRPAAQVDGFILQAMANRPKAQEVLVGLVRDPTFGPVVVVGHGGVAVEVIADRALGLPPLDAASAMAMITSTRVAKLLAGYRDRPPAHIDALVQVLIRLGRLALDNPEVAEVDLNPVLCDGSGALVVDARIALRPAL